MLTPQKGGHYNVMLILNTTQSQFNINFDSLTLTYITTILCGKFGGDKNLMILRSQMININFANII